MPKILQWSLLLTTGPGIPGWVSSSAGGHSSRPWTSRYTGNTQGSRDTVEVPREEPCYAGSRSSAGLQLYPSGVEVGCRVETTQPMLAPDLSLQPLML